MNCAALWTLSQVSTAYLLRRAWREQNCGTAKDDHAGIAALETSFPPTVNAKLALCRISLHSAQKRACPASEKSEAQTASGCWHKCAPRKEGGVFGRRPVPAPAVRLAAGAVSARRSIAFARAAEIVRTDASSAFSPH